MPSPHLPLLFLPMLFLSTLFVRTQPYTVSWNISEALKSVNENFVCWLCELWSFSHGSGVERKAEIVGNERCSRGKVNFHFCRPFWLVCSVVVVGIGHYLITAFYNQSPFSFYPGMVSFPKAPPRPSSLGLTIILLPLCRLVPHAGIWDGALLAAG